MGPYCNYLPYVYLFSQGEVLRAGVSGQMRRSLLTTGGFMLLVLSISVVLTPIYCFLLLRNLRRNKALRPEMAPPAS